MNYSSETLNIISGFYEYCKTGEIKSAGESLYDKEKIAVYRDLVVNNIKNVLIQAYPITYATLKDGYFDKIVNEFISLHFFETPFLWKMPEEFIDFVAQSKYGEKYNIPFLDDLLLFEWTEIEIHTLKTTDCDNSQSKHGLYINRAAKLLRLNYPVHLFAPFATVNKYGHYFLLVYRTADFDVKFADLQILHAYVFEKLKDNFSVGEILKEFSEITSIEKTSLENNILDFVNVLLKEEILIKK